MSLPLARHAGILRADAALQQARLRGTSAIQALGRAGSGFEFVSRHFPAIHAETQRALESLKDAHEVAPLIAECVRHAIVITVLLHSSQQPGTDLPVDLVCLDNRLANSVVADRPQSMPLASGIDALVASYLNAPLYFDHDGGWSDVR
ncbi:hypothetical protein [Microbacterium testaceum]|uniref:hypothetical protein n=1 Tax=Microbacterium testaceum TaxID=2033 RepID=UPI002ACC328E|nr:hypothetical protein [Microbacterium testaceum]